MDPFSLAVATLTFANSFSGGGGDPSGGSGGMDASSSKKTSSSFLDSVFKSGAKAYVASRGKKDKPFQSAEFPKTRSVSELTSPKPFTPVGDMRFITGAENADIQNAMRTLARSSNKDVIRLIPMDIVSPVKKQTKNIELGSSKLGKIE